MVGLAAVICITSLARPSRPNDKKSPALTYVGYTSAGLVDHTEKPEDRASRQKHWHIQASAVGCWPKRVGTWRVGDIRWAGVERFSSPHMLSGAACHQPQPADPLRRSALLKRQPDGDVPPRPCVEPPLPSCGPSTPCGSP